MNVAAEQLEKRAATAAGREAEQAALQGDIRGSSNQSRFGGRFLAGTLVATEFDLKCIDRLKGDERVWSYDLTSGRWTLCRIVETYESDYVGEVVDLVVAGEPIESTYHHPFWVIEGEGLAARPRPEHIDDATVPGAAVPGRWVDAGDLRLGDLLLLKPDRRERISAMAIRQAGQKRTISRSTACTTTPSAASPSSYTTTPQAACSRQRRQTGAARESHAGGAGRRGAFRQAKADAGYSVPATLRLCERCRTGRIQAAPFGNTSLTYR